jgi:predicted DNA-binding transcriptional regulator AlpA
MEQEASSVGKLAYNVPEVARLLGVGKSAAWESVWRGEIPHVIRL